MDLLKLLMEREEEFWKASSAGLSDRIRNLMTDNARMMGFFGILDRETTARSVEGQPPYEFWKIVGEPQLIQITENVATVIYQAYARRERQPQLSLLMSSTYVNKEGNWKLAFHHQTRT